MHFYVRVEKTAEALLAVRKSFFKLKLGGERRERLPCAWSLSGKHGRTELLCSGATRLVQEDARAVRLPLVPHTDSAVATAPGDGGVSPGCCSHAPQAGRPRTAGLGLRFRRPGVQTEVPAGRAVPSEENLPHASPRASGESRRSSACRGDPPVSASLRRTPGIGLEAHPGPACPPPPSVTHSRLQRPRLPAGPRPRVPGVQVSMCLFLGDTARPLTVAPRLRASVGRVPEQSPPVSALPAARGTQPAAPPVSRVRGAGRRPCPNPAPPGLAAERETAKLQMSRVCAGSTMTKRTSIC